MNCGDFRYLIQRRFDVELSSSDDRNLLIHLETCDSCQRFYHQVQQVIMAAEDLELPEDLLPAKADELLGKIIENIPQEKLGMQDKVLSFFQNIGLFKGSSSVPKDQGGLLPRNNASIGAKGHSVAEDFANGQNKQTSRAVKDWDDTFSTGGGSNAITPLHPKIDVPQTKMLLLVL